LIPRSTWGEFLYLKMSRCDVLTTGTKAAVRNLLGTKRSEDRYGWTSPRRFATVIASVRLRTFSFVKMLRKCPFTVVSLLAGLFARCGAAALPVNPDAGSALVGCQSTN